VVGFVASGRDTALHVLGDTGNIAAKLEAQTKQHNCTIIASMDVMRGVGPLPIDLAKADISVPGKEEPVPAVLIRDVREIEAIVSAQIPAAFDPWLEPGGEASKPKEPRPGAADRHR
jgi:adenylate cyclase